MLALSRRRVAAALAAVSVGLALPATASATPIVSTPVPPPSLPAFQGSASTALPLPPSKTTFAPQNPFMAPNPNSNIHNDAWMTDAYPDRSGPLGKSVVATSSAASAFEKDCKGLSPSERKMISAVKARNFNTQLDFIPLSLNLSRSPLMVRIVLIIGR